MIVRKIQSNRIPRSHPFHFWRRRINPKVRRERLIALVVGSVLDFESCKRDIVVGYDTRVGHDVWSDIGVATWSTLRPLINF